ncbi:High-affinity Na(+)/H(+) antiporter NhaS3 [Planctomycetes bacterium CA13]|uniref:High-affinity Na(+)/H(+) antiporter NhaS3 n=1 Tax=Novipirellula herctigrandis TaxID=2527986 RepID=A0A5C5Z0P6_9BACT|nr:High-affinity Na(+)/H(+) antiporter NhaS3 [Planctomycetes bacterium CA13]
MSHNSLSAMLLDLAILFFATYLLSAILQRIRIPPILGALFVAMAAQYTPIGQRLLAEDLYPTFSFMAELGVMFLLFFIGLEIDIAEMSSHGRDILLLTAMGAALPFLLGLGAMLALGYGLTVALVVGMTRIPTAEAVIVPILDDFGLLKTRVGQFIVGVGTLDDFFEVILVVIVSVWIGVGATDAEASASHEVLMVAVSAVVFAMVCWFLYHWGIHWLSQIVRRDTRQLVLLSMVLLIGFGGVCEATDLGMVVGAISAGIVMAPLLKEDRHGEQAMRVFRSIGYGFVGIVFFLWIGLSIDLGGLVGNPTLAILLFLAASVGKVGATLLMVPMGRLGMREALTIGIGLDARLTTEIVVARLLFDAQLIDLSLFTALVAAASLSAITVPVLFAVLVNKWSDYLIPERPADSPMMEKAEPCQR